MSKRQEMREKRVQQERNQKIMIIVGVVLVALAVASILILPSLKPVGEIAASENIQRPDSINFNVVGDPNAPVKIIEYSDYQCPYCANFSKDTEQLLLDAYVATGKVSFEYRTFGEFIGVESLRAGEAAYCAGDQQKFWEMHDIIFANQTGENVGAYSDTRLVAFAEKLGLDMVTFNDCFTSKKYESRVMQDGVDGQAAGVKATPSFTINGKLVEGAQPFDVFKSEIDALLP
jgi:protein-disulfide isomerase